MCLKSWPQFWKIVEEVRSRRRKWVTGMLSLEHHSLRLCVTVASCCGLSNCLFFLSRCLPCHHRLYILNPEPTEAFPLVVSVGYLIIKTKVSNLGLQGFVQNVTLTPHNPTTQLSILLSSDKCLSSVLAMLSCKQAFAYAALCAGDILPSPFHLGNSSLFL